MNAPARSRALRPGHALRLMKGGEQFFPSLVEAISQARAEVLLESYIFEFARSVIPVAQALEAAAHRGVMVCVVDGRIGFCGGINLLDDYFDPNHGALDEPRFDFSARVTGPLVAEMHDTMTRLWMRLQVSREARQFDAAGAFHAVLDAARAGTDMRDVGMKGKVDRSDANADAAAGSLAALVLRDNVRFRSSIEGNYRLAITLAQSEILIANAYFIPGVRLQRALLRAAARGVRITLLLQGKYEY